MPTTKRTLFDAPFVRPTSRAYRADLVSGRDETREIDDAWLAVASTLEHASANIGARRADLLSATARLASEVVDAREVERFVAVEWDNVSSTQTTVLVVLAEIMIQGGALHLAATVLDALATADDALGNLARGRILAQRARIEWMLGNLDAATDRYRRLERLGKAAQELELVVRSLVGRVAVAQMKGNYPEMLRFARRAASGADRGGFRSLARQARSGLMIAASVANHIDEALAHGWKVYEASVGDVVSEAEALQNLGQVLALAEHSPEARAAFAAVVSREPPARILLPALGGLALASADSDHELTARWATGEVKRCLTKSVPRYALASALLECTLAMVRLESFGEADMLRQAALLLAHEHKFHEIALRADQVNCVGLRKSEMAHRALSREAAAVARRVSWLEPSRLPPHVALGVGSA